MRKKDRVHRSHPSSDFGGLLELSSDVGPGIGQRCTYMMSNCQASFVYGTQGAAFSIGGIHSGDVLSGDQLWFH